MQAEHAECITEKLTARINEYTQGVVSKASELISEAANGGGGVRVSGAVSLCTPVMIPVVVYATVLRYLHALPGFHPGATIALGFRRVLYPFITLKDLRKRKRHFLPAKTINL